MLKTILIVDFGSQYTQLIARRFRELQVYCEVRPCTSAAVFDDSVIGVVLSGGPASVLEGDSSKAYSAWLASDLPVLGICFGMQLLAKENGGSVEKGNAKEYGLATVESEASSSLFDGVPKSSTMWMSHGDHVSACPTGWAVAAMSGGVIAAIERLDKRAFGLQFHPEVTHSEHGLQLLKNFAFNVCGAKGDWTSGQFVSSAIEQIKAQVGSEKVLCAVSGGVDSSVVASLLYKAIGEQLCCIFVDNGLLRQGEREAVEEDLAFLNLHVVDGRERFLSALAGVTDPETKRKIIGRLFIEIFDEESVKFGDIRFLAQGTLYPDVIESESVRGPSAVIKSHHNVGGLPDHMKMSLVEPVRELFKDEVRRAGRELGLPSRLLNRKPFPGPGLAVRCLGEVREDRLVSLRAADRIFRVELEEAEVPGVWQCFAALLGVKSVGVMGDSRTYEEAVVLRAVSSVDGMTADWVRIPYDVLTKISTRITNEVPGINRVTYDISSKPPSTIEWE